MTKTTQADRDLFITITQQDAFTADSINNGLQFTGEIELIALYRESAELKERAKIVALLHEHLNDWCKEETESGDIKHQYHQGSDALERLLWAIEEESI